MGYMFSECSGLNTLDVSNFDTSHVKDMSWMFRGCKKLATLDVSGFTTLEMTEMRSLFYGCSSLTSLDLSSFDMSKVQNPSIGDSHESIFKECSKLTSIITPKNVPQAIDVPLPGTYYDADYNFYTALPKNTSKSIKLTRGPADASSAKVSVPEQTYAGKALTPAVTVSLGGKTIASDYYTVSYSNNNKAGTATATVTFNGNYTGKATGNFTIHEAKQTEAPAAQDTSTEAPATQDTSTKAPETPTAHVHTPVALPAVEATTKTTGLTEGSKCSECGEILVPQQVIPKIKIEVREKNDIQYVKAGKKVRLQARSKDAVIKKVEWSIPKKKERKWASINKKTGVVKTKKKGRGHKVHIKARITYVSSGGTVSVSAQSMESAQPMDADLSAQSSSLPETKAASGGTKHTHVTTVKFTLCIISKNFKVTRISGNSSVKAGKSIKLRASTDPSGHSSDVRWSSSNSSVATVSSSGKVKGLRFGSARITCKALCAGSRRSKSKTIRVK